MDRRERLEAPRALRSEAKAHDAVVVGVALTRDEASALSAVDEANGAVVPEQEVVGDLADGGRRIGAVAAMAAVAAVAMVAAVAKVAAMAAVAAVGAMAADREQQLVLGGGEAGGARLLLAPAEEAA
jgi:hypothetical protein